MNRRTTLTTIHIDVLEPRLMLTGASKLLGDALPGIGQPATLTSGTQSLRDLHSATGVAYAHAQGIRGHGQTVAVIDSGIAYDHPALGGGLGQSYRVVGGWDFTAEQDADPYDDAPAGFHGTHVAGIIGSSDSTHLGVAPEVDLVALRVFDDHGRGKLSSLEAALQWVIEHRTAFEHPITTINLSIGTHWNDTTLPHYASLEDEFAQLREQGVFVAVAAGNRFDPGKLGLSYPAASPLVSVAASWNGQGVSEFSQRLDGVFLLPGEQITSTVPDALEDFDGTPNDFYAASGTSMAAPYLAGAAILVREAMQRAQKEISVAAIEAALSETATAVVDPATQSTYFAVDVELALRDILVAHEGVQFQGNTLHWQGLPGTDQIQLHDDHLKWNGVTYQLPPSITRVVLVGDNHDHLELHTGYRGQLDFHPGRLNAVLSTKSIQASGFSSIKTFSQGTGTSARFTGGDAAETFTSKPSHSWMISEGYLNYARGAHSVFALTDDPADVALLYDGPGADNIRASPQHTKLTGPQREVDARGFHQLSVRATGGGHDRASLFGSAQADAVRLTDSYIHILSAATSVHMAGVPQLFVDTGDGPDKAVIDTERPGAQLEVGPHQVTLQTENHVAIRGLTQLQAYARGPQSSVQFWGTELDESLTAKPSHTWLTREESLFYARGFAHVLYQGGGGFDTARLYDSLGDDRFRLSPRAAFAAGPGFQFVIQNTSRIDSISQWGTDQAELHDSASRDKLYATERGVWIRGPDYLNSTTGFALVEAFAGGEHDRLMLAATLATVVREAGDIFVADDDFELVARGFAYYAAQ